MKPFKKKKRLDKIIVNSLIASVIILAISGPIKELCILGLKSFSSLQMAISQKTNFQFEKILNSSEQIEEQKAEIEKLNQGIKTCNLELAQTRRIARKVLHLDNLLKVQRNYFPQSVTAQIIARSPSSWHQELIVDKGSSSGIRAGMVVITDKGILGQIQQVKSNYSIVQLMSSSQIRFGARIRRIGIMGILFGDKAGYGQLKFIPIGSDVKKGDIVQTSGISLNGIERLFPSDYPIGQVIEVNKDDNNSEMFIRVKLFEDGSSIRAGGILILMPNGNKISLMNLQIIPLSETISQTITEEKADISAPISTTQKEKKVTLDNIIVESQIPTPIVQKIPVKIKPQINTKPPIINTVKPPSNQTQQALPEPLNNLSISPIPPQKQKTEEIKTEKKNE